MVVVVRFSGHWKFAEIVCFKAHVAVVFAVDVSIVSSTTFGLIENISLGGRGGFGGRGGGGGGGGRGKLKYSLLRIYEFPFRWWWQESCRRTTSSSRLVSPSKITLSKSMVFCRSIYRPIER